MVTDGEIPDRTRTGAASTRRRFLWSAGTAAFATTASGCIGGSSDGSNDNTDDGNTTNGSNSSEGAVDSISVIMENVYDTTVVKDLLPQFEKNSSFNVNIQSFPYGTMNEKIVTQLRSSTSSYDVIIVDNPWVGNFVKGGLLQPIDDRISNAKSVNSDPYVDTLWNTVGTVNGTSYMLPFYNYAVAMLYRKDLATSQDLKQEYSGPLPTPKYDDLDTYLKVCKFMTRDRNGDGETDLWGASMQAQKGYKITEEWTNYLYSAGGDILSDGKVVLDEGKSAVTALKQYKTNINQASPKAAKSWGFNQARQLMENGNAFNMLTYNWMLGRLSDTEVGDQLAIAEVPGSKAVLGAWGWAIPHNVASDARADAAWEFLTWVESPAVRKQRALKGGAPTCTDTLNDQELLDKYPNYYPVLQRTLKNADPLPSVPGGSEMIEKLGTGLSLAVVGQKTPEKAISDAAAALRDVMG